MKRRLAILICIAMVLSLLPAYAMADDSAKNTDRKAVSQTVQSGGVKMQKPEGTNSDAVRNVALDDFVKSSKKDIVYDDSWVTIYRPSYGEVIYQGEKLWTDYAQYDTWESWYTIPVEAVFDFNDEMVFYNEYSGSIVPIDDWAFWTGKVNINSKNLAPGRYTFMVLNAPAYSDGTSVYNWPSDFEVPYDFSDFAIRKFRAPTNVRLTAGKKKVTIRFNGSTGAGKHQIYRSTKKYSKYKRIKITTKKKFVDKKVKKGKRYYYKVRAVRNASKKGKIFSKFTTPKRSKKVKR